MPSSQTIDLDLSNAETCIELMKQMKTDWKNMKLEVPNIQGSGNLISEIQDMAKIYSALHKSFIKMLDNTITFMNGVKDEFIEKDKTIAEAIK